MSKIPFSAHVVCSVGAAVHLQIVQGSKILILDPSTSYEVKEPNGDNMMDVTLKSKDDSNKSQ